MFSFSSFITSLLSFSDCNENYMPIKNIFYKIQEIKNKHKMKINL